MTAKKRSGFGKFSREEAAHEMVGVEDVLIPPGEAPGFGLNRRGQKWQDLIYDAAIFTRELYAGESGLAEPPFVLAKANQLVVSI